MSTTVPINTNCPALLFIVVIVRILLLNLWKRQLRALLPIRLTVDVS